jgi:uncharacterized tellurite resistance protein B-like protein
MVKVIGQIGNDDKRLAAVNKLQILAYLASSDSDIHENEYELIREMSERNGFTEEEFQKAFYNLTHSLNVIIPKTKREKVSLIYDLLQMMLADGKVTIEEVAIISKISFLFGIPAFRLKDIYIKLIESNKTNISKEAFVHQTLKYL